jgi:hypothetical protein
VALVPVKGGWLIAKFLLPGVPVLVVTGYVTSSVHFFTSNLIIILPVLFIVAIRANGPTVKILT